MKGELAAIVFLALAIGAAFSGPGGSKAKSAGFYVVGLLAAPLLVKLEDTITIGGVVFRITEIKA